ncbi:hypothetical protein [Luteitalea sp.]|uniref:hypothetical protein n=1 Tax=Luteitalea sp. TaxID=2004800 RepID=UPI0025C4C4B4|nr:hypothetical protein [Luteitalea sp.]
MTLEIEASKANADFADALLALRLGVAANALRAQSSLGLVLMGGPDDPASRRDRTLSVVQALGLLSEALTLLPGAPTDPKSPCGRAQRWAHHGEVAEDVAAAMGLLLVKAHPLSAFIKRVRDKHASHWDKAVLTPWLKEALTGTGHTVWLTYAPDGSVVHQASLDALQFALVPQKDGQALVGEFANLMRASAEAMAIVNMYFDAAGIGFLRECGKADRATDDGRANDAEANS